MEKYTSDLHADNFYHVFNQTNNRELLFLDDDDRKLFLEKYKEYVMPYVNTYSYCLLRNHFHFVISVKSVRKIFEHISLLEDKEMVAAHQKFLEMEEDRKTVHKVLAGQFNRLFTSYAMQFNAKYNRKGNLFNRPFKRVKVESDGHFRVDLLCSFQPQKTRYRR